MNSTFSSTHNLVDKSQKTETLTSYEIQKRMYDPEIQTTDDGNPNVGFYMFITGFLVPICWIIGAIVSFGKGPSYSKKWGFANLTALILLIIGIAIWITIIVLNGNGQPTDNQVMDSSPLTEPSRLF